MPLKVVRLNEIAIDVRLQARVALSVTSQLAVWIEYAKEAEEMAAAIGDPRRELTAIVTMFCGSCSWRPATTG